MRVGVDMSILRHPFAGSARWATGLVDSMRREQDVQLTEWRGPRRLVRGGAARKVLNLLRERAWYDIGLPRAASREHSDVLLMPVNLTSGPHRSASSRDDPRRQLSYPAWYLRSRLCPVRAKGVLPLCSKGDPSDSTVIAQPI